MWDWFVYGVSCAAFAMAFVFGFAVVVAIVGGTAWGIFLGILTLVVPKEKSITYASRERVMMYMQDGRPVISSQPLVHGDLWINPAEGNKVRSWDALKQDWVDSEVKL